MKEPSAILLIVGMFILRLGVPLLLTLAIGYGLSRLDAKWQAETQTKAGNGAGSNPPGDEVSWPAQLPGAALLDPRPVALDQAGQPCWNLNDCADKARVRCAGYWQSDLPCWLARTRAEGRMPARCPDCDIYESMTLTWHAHRAVH